MNTLAAAGREIAARNARQSETAALLRLLESRDGLLAEFDEALWLALVRRVKAHAAGSYTFVLMDGTELPWGFPVAGPEHPAAGGGTRPRHAAAAS